MTLACRRGVIVLRFTGEREDESGARVTSAQPVARDSRSVLTFSRLKVQKKTAPVLVLQATRTQLLISSPETLETYFNL